MHSFNLFSKIKILQYTFVLLQSNTGCEVCEACGKILNPSDSKGNSKLVNKNSYLQSNTKNGTVYKESYGNSENASKDKKDAKADKKAEKKIDKKVDKKLVRVFFFFFF